MSQRPLVVGLLLCESLIVEEGTHNVTLVNCFTNEKGEAIPFRTACGSSSTQC